MGAEGEKQLSLFFAKIALISLIYVSLSCQPKYDVVNFNKFLMI